MFVVEVLRAIADAHGNTLDDLNSPEKMGVKLQKEHTCMSAGFGELALVERGEGWRVGEGSGNSEGASGCVSAKTVCARFGLALMMEWAGSEPRSVLNALTKEGECVWVNGGSVPDVA